MRAVVLEQEADDALDLRVLAPRDLAQVDALEHEVAQRGHRAGGLLALHDRAGALGVLDEVVDERVDARRAGVAEHRDRVRAAASATSSTPARSASSMSWLR